MTEYKKVKLICTDPLKPGYLALVVDAETGQPITNFDSLAIHIDVRSIPTAIMHVVAPEIDVEVNAVVKQEALKCAMQSCQNAARLENQVNGSYLPFAEVSNIDIWYSWIAAKVTLYLCDKCLEEIRRGIN